jgi:hypothetical protein
MCEVIDEAKHIGTPNSRVSLSIFATFYTECSTHQRIFRGQQKQLSSLKAEAYSSLYEHAAWLSTVKKAKTAIK